MPTVAWSCARAGITASADDARTMAIIDLLSNMSLLLLVSTSGFPGEDALPVGLHADDQPALLLRLVVKCLGEGADPGVRQSLRRAVGVFAYRIVVQENRRQPRATARLGVFEHLAVAGRVAECRHGPTADHQVDALGLAGVVVVQQELRLLG